jgi:hypothetical protein
VVTLYVAPARCSLAASCSRVTRHQPFPLNKSFKPPAPLSDHLKNMIWLMHDADRVNHNARHIAAEMGLSIPRVEAILKLKYLEKGWEKVRQVS